MRTAFISPINTLQLTYIVPRAFRPTIVPTVNHQVRNMPKPDHAPMTLTIPILLSESDPELLQFVVRSYDTPFLVTLIPQGRCCNRRSRPRRKGEYWWLQVFKIFANALWSIVGFLEPRVSPNSMSRWSDRVLRTRVASVTEIAGPYHHLDSTANMGHRPCRQTH
jgi:hypothetical protein